MGATGEVPITPHPRTNRTHWRPAPTALPRPILCPVFSETRRPTKRLDDPLSSPPQQQKDQTTRTTETTEPNYPSP